MRTDDSTIRLITAAVRDALRPNFDEIHRRIDEVHGRVTESAGRIERIDERTSHMPTKEETLSEIATHSRQCDNRRRWWIGLIFGIPGAALAALGVAHYLPI